jgi:predicted ester cyclase
MVRIAIVAIQSTALIGTFLCWASSAGMPAAAQTLAQEGRARVPAAQTSADSAQLRRNKDVILRYFQTTDGGDFRTAAAAWADTAQNYGEPLPRNAQAFFQAGIEDIHRTFPDWHMEVLDLIAEGDSVVALCRASGTHQGVGRLPLNGNLLVGVAPTGKRFEVAHIHWFKLRNGKIVDHYVARDDVGMYKQLGILPNAVVSDTSTRLTSIATAIVRTTENGETTELGRNKSVVRHFFESQNDRSFHVSAPVASGPDLQAAYEDLLRTFPDWRWTIVDAVAQGDSVVALCRASGTHRGVEQFPLNGGLMVGVEATGKHFEVWHMHWFKLRDGKIVDHYQTRDDIGMYRQLGLLPQ